MNRLDEIAVYSGFKISETQEPVDAISVSSHNRIPLDDDDVVNLAEQKAAAIIAAAKEEADKIRAEIRAEALEAEKQRAVMVVNRELAEFTRDIWSSTQAMSKILGEALTQIVGEQAMPDAQIKAIHHAVSKYYDGRKLTIRVSPRDATRLKVVMLGNGNSDLQDIVEIKEDIGINRGRCILEAMGKSIEIGLDHQINAFKRTAEKYFAKKSSGGSKSKTAH